MSGNMFLRIDRKGGVMGFFCHKIIAIQCAESLEKYCQTYLYQGYRKGYSPLFDLVTLESYARMGISISQPVSVGGTSDQGDLSCLDISKTLAQGTPVFTVKQDHSEIALPKGIVVSSWQLSNLSIYDRMSLFFLLKIVVDNQIPVLMVRSASDSRFQLYPLPDSAKTFDLLCQESVPVVSAQSVEQTVCRALGISRDELCHLNTCSLIPVLHQWNSLHSYRLDSLKKEIDRYRFFPHTEEQLQDLVQEKWSMPLSLPLESLQNPIWKTSPLPFYIDFEPDKLGYYLCHVLTDYPNLSFRMKDGRIESDLIAHFQDIRDSLIIHTITLPTQIMSLPDAVFEKLVTLIETIPFLSSLHAPVEILQKENLFWSVLTKVYSLTLEGDFSRVKVPSTQNLSQLSQLNRLTLSDTNQSPPPFEWIRWVTQRTETLSNLNLKGFSPLKEDIWTYIPEFFKRQRSPQSVFMRLDIQFNDHWVPWPKFACGLDSGGQEPHFSSRHYTVANKLSRASDYQVRSYSYNSVAPTFEGCSGFLALDGTAVKQNYERHEFYTFSVKTFGFAPYKEDKLSVQTVPYCDNLIEAAKAFERHHSVNRIVLRHVEFSPGTYVLPTFLCQDLVLGYTTSDSNPVRFNRDDLSWFVSSDREVKLNYILATSKSEPPYNGYGWEHSLPVNSTTDQKWFLGMAGHRPNPTHVLFKDSPFLIFNKLACSQSRKNRIEAVINFCHGFSEIAPSQTPEINTAYYERIKSAFTEAQWQVAYTMLEACRTKAGVCLERTEVAVFLLSLCDISCVGTTNGLHAFIQIQTRSGEWIPRCLGGGDGRVNIKCPSLSSFECTPTLQDQNPSLSPVLEEATLPEAPKIIQVPVSDSTGAGPQLDSVEPSHNRLDSEKPREVLAPLELKKTAPVAEYPKWVSLSIIDTVVVPESKIERVLTLIYQTEVRPVFVLADMAHFEAQMTTLGLSEGIPVKQSGPLKLALERGVPIHVVILLSGFESEISKINSLLDRAQRKLEGIGLHADSQVTVFVEDVLRVGTDVTSRIGTPRFLSESLFRGLEIPKRVQISEVSAEGSTEVCLDFSDPLWRTTLYGGVELGSEGFKLQVGCLFSGKEISLYVGSDGILPAFRVDMIALNTQPGASVSLIEEKFGNNTRTQLQHLLNKAVVVQNPKYYLGASVYSVNHDRFNHWMLGTTLDGTTHKVVKKSSDFSQIQHLYLTQDPSLTQWIWLAEHFSHIETLGLAPSIKLPTEIRELCGDVTDWRGMSKKTQFPSYVVVSNDPHGTASRIDSPRYVVSSLHDANSEILQADLDFKTWTGHLTPTPFLEQMQKPGQMVILGIKPGTALWRTFEPLLLGESIVQVHGQELQVQSHLIIVVHHKHKKHPALDVLPCYYDEHVSETRSVSAIPTVDSWRERLDSEMIVGLSGPTGSGKSTLIDYVLNEDKYVRFSLKTIRIFLEAPPEGKRNILVIDNVEDVQKNAPKFLKGLLHNPPTILWKGSIYSLNSKTHGVIISGIKDLESIRHGIFNHIQTFSMPSGSYRKALLDLRAIEFKPIETLTDSLKQQGVWLCQGNREYFQKIYDIIQLSEYRRSESVGTLSMFNQSYIGKNHLRLEGLSGVGKSTATAAILRAMGYTLVHHDAVVVSQSKVFLQGTPQNKQFLETILETGLRFGIPVIVDEYNTLKWGHCTAYLKGEFPLESAYYGTKPSPGFVAILTANDPRDLKARIRPSGTLIDLTQELFWTTPYTRSHFDEILVQAFPAQDPPHQVVKEIEHYLCSACSDHSANSRPVFDSIRDALVYT